MDCIENKMIFSLQENMKDLPPNKILDIALSEALSACDEEVNATVFELLSKNGSEKKINPSDSEFLKIKEYFLQGMKDHFQKEYKAYIQNENK